MPRPQSSFEASIPTLSPMSADGELQPVQIRKGTSTSNLQPFRSIGIPSHIRTLAQIRTHLYGFEFMTENDSFLNKSLYVVHLNREAATPWASELRRDPGDDGEEGALCILVKVGSVGPVTAADGTLRIFKGTSVDKLEPFKAIKVTSDTETLAQLRTKLNSDMDKSDRFLTTDNFPVHIKDEDGIKWATVLQPKAEGKEDSGAVAILSTGSKPSIPPPTLPDKHEFETLPDGKTLVVPVPPQSPTAKAYRGEAQPNAKMLSEDQAKTVVCLPRHSTHR